MATEGKIPEVREMRSAACIAAGIVQILLRVENVDPGGAYGNAEAQESIGLEELREARARISQPRRPSKTR